MKTGILVALAALALVGLGVGVVAAQAISQAEENLRINENRYRENVGTGTDVIDAQTLLTQTRTDYDQALFDYQVAIARIRKAAGEL